MAASPTDRWYIPDLDVIDWHEWGDEFVVRVASRAETHLLSPAAGSILLALLDNPSALTLEALYAKACGVHEAQVAAGPVMTEDERNDLRAVVVGFERLGIALRQAA